VIKLMTVSSNASAATAGAVTAAVQNSRIAHKIIDLDFA